MMRMSSVIGRPSRRTALVGAIFAGFLVLAIMVVKDMSDKLGVMTASNQAYQRMTDKQSERIKALQNSLKEEESSHQSGAKAETELRLKAEKEMKTLKRQVSSLEDRAKASDAEADLLREAAAETSKQMDSLVSHNGKFAAEAEGLRKEVTRLNTDKEGLRKEVAALAAERDRFKEQYLALFREHQRSSDSIQSLRSEQDRLKLQLKDMESPPSNKAGKGFLPVLLQPNSASSSTPRSLGGQQVNLQEPFVPNDRISSTPRTVSTDGQQQQKMAVPVVAEPPHNAGSHFYREVVPDHAVQKEDVMEAPGMYNQQQPNFNQYLHQQPLLGHQQQQQQQEQPLDRPNVHQVYMPHQQNYAHSAYRQFEQPPARYVQRRDAKGINLADGRLIHHGVQQQQEEEQDEDFPDAQMQGYPLRHKSVDHEGNKEVEDTNDNIVQYRGYHGHVDDDDDGDDHVHVLQQQVRPQPDHAFGRRNGQLKFQQQPQPVLQRKQQQQQQYLSQARDTRHFNHYNL